MVKNLSANVREPDLIPGRSPGEGKGLATQSSILARRIPGDEPGRLQSMGSERDTTAR